MERKKSNTKAFNARLRNLEVMSTLVDRLRTSGQLGMSYEGERDLYRTLGYPTDIEWEDYFDRYTRQDIATAIIDRPVKTSWKGGFDIVETKDKNETALEKAWNELDDKIHFDAVFRRLDTLTGIGEYGCLLLGLSDVVDNEDLKKKITKGSELLYVKPLSQATCVIAKLDNDQQSKRYGLPYLYDVDLTQDTDTTMSLRVHHSRIVHVVDGKLESETLGRPRLEKVYNRLMDLDKLTGGSAEMFWRGARPGYAANTKEGYQMGATEEAALEANIEEYENDLKRILLSSGVDLQALQTQVSDPKSHVDIQIQMISAATNIPKRILTGSERGELSSGQDSDEWIAFNQSRREEFNEPCIVRAVVDRLIKYKVLPEPKIKYSVDWASLASKSDKDKADTGNVQTEALDKYANNPVAQSIVPPDNFLEMFLGLSDEKIEILQEQRKAQEIEQAKIDKELDEVEKDMLKEEKKIQKEAQLKEKEELKIKANKKKRSKTK